MSAQLVGLCWHYQMTRPERAVLQMLADHAKDDGTECHPGIDRMMWMGDFSRAQLKRIMRALEQKRLIIPVSSKKGGRGIATEYEIRLENGVFKPEYLAWQERLRARRESEAQVDSLEENEQPAPDDYVGQFWAWLQRNHYKMGSRADSARYQAQYRAEMNGTPQPEPPRKPRGRPRKRGGGA